MEHVGITIVGAGVVGLAVGAQLSAAYKNVFVVEKESSFGQAVSSRNSEVIHAGIYYPKDSLKARLCVEGRHLLYQFCREKDIAHKKIGKIIVAVNEDEVNDLMMLYKKAKDNGVDDVMLLDAKQVKVRQPNINAYAGLYSPSTGIIDSHGLMKRLAGQVRSSGGEIIYNTEVKGIDWGNGAIEVLARELQGEFVRFSTDVFINCAGLHSDEVARMAGINDVSYQLKYCKGDYFRVNSNKAKFINQLVYPVPRDKGPGLGIHATLDLAGGMRLGPDAEYIGSISYDVDSAKRILFYENVRLFLPFIEENDLTPDTAGVRPKLQGANDDFRDFIIKEESGKNFSCLINLIGIESPGLTAALAIAKMVKSMVDKMLYSHGA